MQHNTDKEKATVRQKAPDKTQMDAMIQRSKDYGLKVAAPNMKTDTQPTHKIVTSGDISYVVTSDIDAALDRQACFNRMHYAQGQEAIAKREATAYKAHADKLAEALRKLLNRLDNITSDQFAHGAERIEREAARNVLAAYKSESEVQP